MEKLIKGLCWFPVPGPSSPNRVPLRMPALCLIPCTYMLLAVPITTDIGIWKLLTCLGSRTSSRKPHGYKRDSQTLLAQYSLFEGVQFFAGEYQYHSQPRARCITVTGQLLMKGRSYARVAVVLRVPEPPKCGATVLAQYDLCTPGLQDKEDVAVVSQEQY